MTGKLQNFVPCHMEYDHFYELTSLSFFSTYSLSKILLEVLVNVGDQDLQLSESFIVLLESNWTMTQDFIEEIQLSSLIILY